MSTRLKHIGCLSIFVGLLLLTDEKQAAPWSLFKDNICALFPAEKIVKEIDAGNGYKQNKKQVYDAYYKIATRLIHFYRSEISRLNENQLNINDAYDFTGPFIEPFNYLPCRYTVEVEYDVKSTGIKTTDLWINFPNFHFYTKKKEYVNGSSAFALYQLQLKFSKNDGDLLEVDVQKYNVNFDRFPFYATSLGGLIPLNQREQGLVLKKTEFPHG